MKFSLALRAIPRLAKPSDQPQVQRERVCKTRGGENAAGKWVRRIASREVDYALDDPTKLREFATFAEAFAFDEACRADSTGGRSAKYAAQPKSSVPEEQRAVCTAIADALRRSKSTLPSSSSSASATALAAEQRQPALESCAAASAAASAAEQREQETTTAASAAKLAAEQLGQRSGTTARSFGGSTTERWRQDLWPSASLTTPARLPLQ